MKSVLILITFFLSEALAQYEREAKTLHIEGTSKNKRWVDVYKDREQNVSYLIETLERSEMGKELLEMAQSKAAKHGSSVNEIIVPDVGSITDTTLTRRFSESRPDKIKYFVKSKIHINRELTVTQAVLDLAHELTHYIHRDAFNPYSNKFTIDSFIVSTIEGQGGEVDAYINECRVLYELFPDLDGARSKCDKVRNSDGSYSKRNGAKMFYQVGTYRKSFNKILGYFQIPHTKFKMVTGDLPSFISSAYGEPYPYAAIKEYVNVMRKACRNDEKRVGLFGDKVKNRGRYPASSKEAKIFTKQNFDKIRKNYFKRCSAPGLFKANDALY